MPIRLVIVPIIIAQTRPSARSNPPESGFTFGGICTKLRADAHLESPTSHRKNYRTAPFSRSIFPPPLPQKQFWDLAFLHLLLYKTI